MIKIFGECEYTLQVNDQDKRGCGGLCKAVGDDEFQLKAYFDIDAKIEQTYHLMSYHLRNILRNLLAMKAKNLSQ